MSLDVQHLGHACIKVKNAGVSLTSDPWFYSAFLHGWFPYPNNRHLLDKALDSDYIYISHAHEDHLDREFLKQVDIKRTTIIVPKFRSRYLQQEVEKITGIPPIVLGHEESYRLPGDLHIRMFIDRSHKEDSALLVECGGFRFLNSNDCELAISDWPTSIDLLACQFSGATWYPQCYDMDTTAMSRKTQEVRKSNFERLCRRVESTGAKSYLPSAGPAAFLDPALTKFNRRGGIFPTWPELEWEFTDRFPNVAIWDYFNDRTDLTEYSRMRRGEWGKYYAMDEKFVTQEELGAHFIELQKRNKRFVRDWHKDINVSSASWLAGSRRSWNIRLGLVTGELEETFNPEYFMDVPPRVLRALIDGRISWETALISHRVKLARTPDVYDNMLMGLLNFGDRPIQTLTMAQQQASDEMTTKDGYEFQRWCPHAGEDLNYASVKDGKLVCPRHGWCWNVATGECLTGQGVPLKTRSST